MYVSKRETIIQLLPIIFNALLLNQPRSKPWSQPSP